MKEHLIVFDINGTLLKRVRKHQNEEVKMYNALGKVPDVITENFDFYFSDNLKKLDDYLESKKIKYVFWSTMFPHNLKLTVASLNVLGFKNYCDLFDYHSCRPGPEKGDIKADRWVKDLRLVADKHNIPLEGCLLIDDTILKVAPGNNSFIVSKFDPVNDLQDDGIDSIINAIEKFVHN